VSGGKTGVGQSLPATPNTLSQPNVVVGQQGKGGAGAAAGTSAGQVQRGGEGVLVTGQTGKGSSGNLDLSRLDKAIAGSGTGGGAGAAKGSAGSGQSGSGSGSGGTGTGVDGGTGTGSGGYSVVWDQPEASKGRKLVSAAKPKLPPWVSAQGLSLSVTVSFTLTADGVVKGVKVSPSSGYADVDNAIADAIRNWRFTTAKGAPDIKGVIPYLIKAQ
jgi:TonB family protein